MAQISIVIDRDHMIMCQIHRTMYRLRVGRNYFNA